MNENENVEKPVTKEITGKGHFPFAISHRLQCCNLFSFLLDLHYFRSETPNCVTGRALINGYASEVFSNVILKKKIFKGLNGKSSGSDQEPGPKSLRRPRANPDRKSPTY